MLTIYAILLLVSATCFVLALTNGGPNVRAMHRAQWIAAGLLIWNAIFFMQTILQIK